MARFKHLFTPLTIGSMKLDNRIVMSPMTTDYGTGDQEPSMRLLAYLEERAKGGVGLITLEVCSVALDHRYQMNSLSLADDRFIDKHREITAVVHRHGVKIQPQITHPGPESLAPFFEGKQGIGPSVNVNPSTMQATRALELPEIPGIIEQYVAACSRAQKAGYDGVEIHAAHSYMLLGSFLSPLRNGRDDEYGGKRLENRAKLLLEVVSAVRAVVGKEFPVTIGLSGYERFPGGREINETQRLAQMLVAAGASAFRISGGITDKLVSQMVMGTAYSNAANASAARAIKQAVNVPVMVVGRVHTPELAERLLVNQDVDLVAMARPFLADPEWPIKARKGQVKEIRKCISCQNCIDSMIQFQNMNCAVNAATGREMTNRLKQAKQKKHVVIIGAGPAGMEAARVSALRGHQVTLIERQKRLGGSLVLASAVHEENEAYLLWLARQVRSQGINLLLGVEATPELIRSKNADALIVAVGAQVDVPEIKGSDLPHVFNGVQLRSIMQGDANSQEFTMLPVFIRTTAKKLLKRYGHYLTPKIMRKLSQYWMPIGKNVVVIGADLAALELAEFIAKRGRRVAIMEASKRIAQEIGPKRLAEHMDRLDKLGVTVNTEVSYEAIDKNCFYYANSQGESFSVKANTVIIAGVPIADTAIYDAVQEMTKEVYAIGDCVGLGLIRGATDDAMRVACQI